MRACRKMSERPIVLITLILLAALIQACADRAEREVVLTTDGNLLFYNGPALTTIGKQKVVAYLTSDGHIMVADVRTPEAPRIIHDFRDRLFDGPGRADDHAAPAIMASPDRQTFWLATAYHGTPLHLYQLDTGLNVVRRLSPVEGQFTYPRWVDYGDRIDLFIRDQSRGSGDLVSLSSQDDFQSTRTVLSGKSGQYLYPGSFVRSGMRTATHYSHNRAADTRLRGWTLVEFEPTSGSRTRECDLSHLLGDDAASNRPTGLHVQGDRVTLATSVMTETEFSKPERAFTMENRVIIARGSLNDCASFAVIHAGEATAPYYHTSVAIDAQGWTYFDGDQAVSDPSEPDCFQNDRMLYPQRSAAGILYASLNDSIYEIRKFDNSLHL